MSAVLLEGPCQGKLPQPMAHHVFSDKNRVENLTVVDIKSEANEIGSDHRTTRPRLDRRFGFLIPCPFDLLHQVMVNEGAFFDRTSHILLLELHWPAIPADNYEPI